MRLPRSLARLSKGNFGSIAANVVLPFLIFVQVSPALGQARALMIASVPPIAWNAAELARSRRFDALSLLVVATLALSIGALAGGGSARALQLRQHLVNAVLGLAFLASAAIGRPLTHYVGQAQQARRTGQGSDAGPAPDRTAMMTTLIWGFGLAGQSPCRPVCGRMLPGPHAANPGRPADRPYRRIWSPCRRRGLGDALPAAPAAEVSLDRSFPPARMTLD